ncbi:MAG: endonuclease V [candidate division KSB1 bacterium]|nr:endonuclease V [candidate division KSB1 bacterium]
MLQRELAALARFPRPRKGPIATVAAGDVSYAKGDRRAWAAVVVCSLPDLQVVEAALASGAVDFPYVPGLLSFREGPLLLRAFAKLSFLPDVALFDGQGAAHPCGLGLASHIGLCLGLPSVGCAKSRLVGEHGEIGQERGAFSPLLLDGRTIGAAVRTRSGCNPVYVSAGYRMTLSEAIAIVLKTVTCHRLPEPLRQAHVMANQRRSMEG